MNSNDEKRLTERSTRLGLILILFGALFFIFKLFATAWYRAFTEHASVKMYFNVSYILSVSTVAMSSLIILSVIRYLYHELQTFIHYDDREEEKMVLARAEKSYKEIFHWLKVCFFGIILTALYLDLCIYLIPYISLVYIVLIGFLLLIILTLVCRKKLLSKLLKIELLKLKDDKIKINFSKLKFVPSIFIFFIILMVVFFLGLGLTTESIKEIGTIKIGLKETNNIPIKIDLQSYTDPKVYLKISNNSASPKNISFKLNADQLQKSSMEVMESDNKKDLEKHNSFFNNSSFKELESFSIKESQYFYTYNVNLKKYIKNGKNEVTVVILPRGYSDTIRIDATTTISKDKNVIKIARKNFTHSENSGK